MEKVEQPGQPLNDPGAATAGAKAFARGEGIETCPHSVACAPFSRNNWLEGWYAARRKTMEG